VVVTTSSVALGDDRREYRQALFDMVEKEVIGEIQRLFIINGGSPGKT